MVYIFIESLFGVLVQFGTLVSIGIGTIAFCAVVIITIVAAETFDSTIEALALRGRLTHQ